MPETSPLADAWRQLTALPRPVQLWMRWLNLVFLAGLVFAPDHAPARWALVAWLVCLPAAVPCFLATRDIALTGLPHLLFWTPLLVALPVSAADDPAFRLLSAYGVWTVLLLVTVAVSVVFDARAVVQRLVRRHGPGR